MPAKIIAVGELLVEFVSHTKGCALEEISNYSGPYPSGAPAIFIDQAARLGAQTAMYGGVGDDGFGKALLQRLKDNGVDVEHVIVDPERPTGVAFVSYFEDGQRTFIFHMAGTAADSFLIPTANLELRETLLHISASSLGNPNIRKLVLEVFEQTVAAGGKVSCDPNIRPELIRDTAVRVALDDIISKCTYLLPSTDDLAHLYPGMTEEAAIDRLRSGGAEVIALKRGSKGALIVDGKSEFAIAPHTVTEVDPTGAGDCFCGTFLALLTQGYSVENAGELANAAGALSVTRRGPMEGNSSLELIQKFLSGK